MYIMPMIVSICQHCDEQQFRNTVRCTLHDFLSSKVGFIHTSTVTRSHSCSEKNYAYASRTSCYIIILLYILRVRLAYILLYYYIIVYIHADTMLTMERCLQRKYS